MNRHPFIPRIGLRWFTSLTYAGLVMLLAVGLVVLVWVHHQHSQQLYLQVQEANRANEIHVQLESIINRRQALLLASVQHAHDADIDLEQQLGDQFFRLLMELATLAQAWESGPLINHLDEVRRSVQAWEQEFVVPTRARRDSQASMPTELLTRGDELARHLRADLGNVRRFAASLWEGVDERMQREFQHENIWVVGIIVGVLLLAGGMLILLNRSIEHPVMELNRLTQQVVSGAPADRPEIRSFVEIEQLADNFSAMVATLQERESQLRTSHAATVRTNEDLLLLTEYVRFLQQEINETAIAGTLVRQAQRVTGAVQVGMYLRRRSLPEFVLEASHPPLESESLTLRQRVCLNDCSVLRSNQLLQIQQHQPELCRSCQPTESQQGMQLCVPLTAGGEVIGSLHLVGDADHRWTQAASDLVISLVNLTAPTISNLRLLETMQEKATRDQLTGLHNRRFADELIPGAIETARRHQQPLALVLLDIDHFKRLNDSMGHDVGDRVLREIAQSVRQAVRASDVVCRMGGEEFLVVLPQTDLEGAGIIAEKLRSRVADQYCLGVGDYDQPVTISLGVACFPQHGSLYAELYKSADLALYRAKAAGRNQIHLFEATPVAHE